MNTQARGIDRGQPQETVTQKNINQLTGLSIRQFYSIRKDCQICTELLIQSDSGNSEVIRMDCGATFHKECIQSKIQAELSEYSYRIRCPALKCNENISTKWIRQLQRYESHSNDPSKKNVDRFFQFQLERLLIDNPIQLSCCPTPGCKYIFKIDPFGKPTMSCEICANLYCLKCQSIAHPLYTCDEFKLTKNRKDQESAFSNLMQQQQCKMCPKCGVWIQKSQGCNHMVCRCGHELCYRCGRKYRDPNCKCPLFDRSPNAN